MLWLNVLYLFSPVTLVSLDFVSLAWKNNLLCILAFLTWFSWTTRQTCSSFACSKSEIKILTWNMLKAESYRKNVILFFLLALNVFRIWFYGFHCWDWTSKRWIGILCLNFSNCYTGHHWLLRKSDKKAFVFTAAFLPEYCENSRIRTEVSAKRPIMKFSPSK